MSETPAALLSYWMWKHLYEYVALRTFSTWVCVFETLRRRKKIIDKNVAFLHFNRTTEAESQLRAALLCNQMRSQDEFPLTKIEVIEQFNHDWLPLLRPASTQRFISIILLPLSPQATTKKMRQRVYSDPVYTLWGLLNIPLVQSQQFCSVLSK